MLGWVIENALQIQLSNGGHSQWILKCGKKHPISLKQGGSPHLKKALARTQVSLSYMFMVIMYLNVIMLSTFSLPDLYI